MADEKQPPQSPPQQPQQQQGAPSLHISAQYVKDLSFENPNAPRSLMSGAGAPQVSVHVDVRTNQLNEQTFEVLLTIKGDAKISDDTQAFLIELAYGGVVTLSGVAKEQAGPLLLIETPRQLFPFARAVIAEATRNGGFPPLLIQPIDFAALYRRQLEALRARQQQGAEGGAAGGAAPPTVN